MNHIKILAEEIIVLDTFNDWVRKCPNCLPKKKNRHEQWLFVDKNGCVLTVGEDFMMAQENKSFPVKVYKLKRTSES